VKLRIAVVLTALALALSACGGAEEPEEPSVPGGADPAQVEVIDEWSRSLAAGDVDAAAEFFAIPSIAQNGLPYEIASRADARRFNSSLPCGASLVEARTEGDYTVATFELTERPGAGSCGNGDGSEASTAFRIVDGEIVEWRRVLPDGSPEAAPAPSTEV
jgi:hypothetical protein